MYTLVVGLPEDVVIQHFFSHVDLKQNPRLVFINLHHLGSEIILSEQGWEMRGGGEIPHHQVAAVYNRMLSKPPKDSRRQPYDYLVYLLDEIYPNVINRPKHTMGNFSKLWQLDIAKSLGFEIPDSYVIANGKVGRDAKGEIFKSISSYRSIVAARHDNFRQLVHEPVLFQSDCGRVGVRVHVIGKDIVAVRVRSNNVDYRYDSASSMELFSLPDWLEERCVFLSDCMGLCFSGIDLMHDEGVYKFLEINPSPGYAYYERVLRNNRVSMSLIKTLGLYV